LDLASEEAGKTQSRGVLRALPAADDDAALARNAAQGDAAAARIIWDRHAAMVRGLLRRTMGPGDVDDLVQESFLRFFRLIGRLRDPDKLRAFLVGISLRVAREELRRRRVRRWLTLSGDGQLPEATAPASDMEGAQALGRLYELLDRIDATSRTVFVLRYVEQIPTAELAEIMECSLATAKRRVQRATAKVHKLAAQDAALVSFVSQGGLQAPLSDEDDGSGQDHG
jgi:RNA polymerase sigma-70 factor (ECF subfamily)